MIKRIVKLSFQPQLVDKFFDIFAAHRERLLTFPGCRHVELLRCQSPPNVFFTLSFWEEEEALENYRRSELFRETWTKTKALFSAPPEAWTVEEV